MESEAHDREMCPKTTPSHSLKKNMLYIVWMKLMYYILHVSITWRERIPQESGLL